MSECTLNRKLKAQGTSYQMLLATYDRSSPFGTSGKLTCR